MSSYEESGYLELFIGPMFSGKTSKLIDIYKKLKLCNQNILVINFNKDNRYSNFETHLSSHDEKQIPCKRTEFLKDIFDINLSKDDHELDQILSSAKQSKNSSLIDFINSIVNPFDPAFVKYILINEGQFFPDLTEWVTYMVNVLKKHIYIAGLDGDFNRKPIGQILEIIPQADKVTKLKSLCTICKNGKEAIFSYRKTNDTNQVLIGSDNYLPLCRNCYNNKTNDKTDIHAYSTSEYGAEYF